MEKGKTVRKKLFLDTNIIISGLFFKGNESKLLLLSVELYTSDTIVFELKEVVTQKFKSLKIESKRIAFKETERALMDFKIVKEKEYAIIKKVIFPKLWKLV
ncbi:PIN domain-containing protein [candidate division WOR-3 bacterium]|nr:PIN domain-containing protein [candidate division WOR-3 bacterium]